MMTHVLPKTFKNCTNVVADSELVIEFTSGSSMFHIYKKEKNHTLEMTHSVQRFSHLLLGV